MTKLELSNKLYDVLGQAIDAYIEKQYDLAREYYAEAQIIYHKLSKYKRISTLHRYLSFRCQLTLNPGMHLMEIDHPAYQAINFFERGEFEK